MIRPFMAKLTILRDGIRTHHNLGYFDTTEEAARAYDAKAVELYGEYAFQNFPKKKNKQ